FLARHDSDPFNRWQSLQDVAEALIVDAVGGKDWSDADIAALSEALQDTVTSKTLDPSFKALALGLPTEPIIARSIGNNVDPDRIRAVRLRLIGELVGRLAPTLTATYRDYQSSEPYAPDTAQSG